jgi:ribosomal protein S18 acetylase RimI-like enzyme
MSEAKADNFDLERLDIRPAEPSDHAVICDLFYSGVVEGQVHSNDTGADIENLQEGYFADEGESGFWVASYGDDVIGMIGVQKTLDNVAEIRRLRVKQGFRRKSVGTQLMKHAIMFCQRRGYLKVTLDVQIDRGPAIALFDKFGFKHARSREVNGRKMLDFLLDLYSEPEESH